MRIAVIIQSPFKPNTHCALSTWTQEVYGRLAEKCDVTVFAPGHIAPITAFKVLQIRPSKLAVAVERALRNREIRGAIIPLKRYVAIRRMANWAVAIPTNSFDVIHIHNCPAAAIAVRRKHRSIRIVLHMQNDHLVEIDKELSKLAIQSADLIAFISRHARQKVLDNINEPKLASSMVVYNGAASAGKAPDEAPRRSEVVFVGRIIRFKGVHVLLEAFRKVHARMGWMRLVIVGPVDLQNSDSLEYYKGLRAAAQSLGDAVEFIGTVSQGSALEYMRRAAVFVCPSLWDEPFGMVNAEAMAVGTPVIAFARGGIPEVVGSAGVLVEESTSEALAAAILDLLGDPARLERLGRAGQERVRDLFNWDLIASDWYNSLARLTMSTK